MERRKNLIGVLIFLIFLFFNPVSIESSLLNVTPPAFLFSFTSSTPTYVNGVQINGISEYDKDLYAEFDPDQRRMNLNFQIADTECDVNQWYCDGVCIHRRERCLIRGGCHPQYPIPCRDKDRCFRSSDDCWHKGCLNTECAFESRAASLGAKQRRFLASCPDERYRLLPCDTENNPLLPSRGRKVRMVCFYSDEQYCPPIKSCAHVSSKCFKRMFNSVMRQEVPGSNYYSPDNNYQRRPTDLAGGEIVGWKPLRNPNCPNKWTPCFGICVDSDYPFKCGKNLCLSIMDIRFYRECGDLCVRNHVACQGSCRLGYSPCRANNQCFRDPEGRCDYRKDCWDGSDETGCFRTFVWWVGFPTLIFLLILILAVYFTMGVFIRRTLSVPPNVAA